jgi:hypothetical protein
MEYPGSKLTKRWRRALLALFIILFFIISPSVVLYTSGYRFDINNGLVKQVGVLSVDGEPLTTAVYINGLKQTNHLPAKFTHLIPGTYQLMLSAPGFHPLEQTISIRAKETTYIKNVDLSLQQEPERITTYLPSNTVLLKESQALVYTSTTASGTIIFYQKIAMDPHMVTTTHAQVDEMRVSPHEEYVAVMYHSIPIFFIETKTLQTFSPHIQRTPWYWDTAGSDIFIYHQTTSTILATNLKNETVLSTTTKQQSENWTPYNYHIWHIDTTGPGLNIYSSSTNLLFNRENEWNKNLRSWTKGSLWQSYTSYNNTHFLTNNTHTEIAIISRSSFYSIPVSTVHHEIAQKKTLLYGPFEVWKYTANESEPVFIYRSSEPLRAVESMNDTDLYLLATNHALFSYQYVYSITTHLVNDVDVVKAWAIPSKRIIVFTGTYHKIPGVWKLAY